MIVIYLWKYKLNQINGLTLKDFKSAAKTKQRRVNYSAITTSPIIITAPPNSRIRMFFSRNIK